MIGRNTGPTKGRADASNYVPPIVRPTRASRIRLADHLDQFTKRIIIDALNEATAAYWQHRAEQFEAACWRPGDYTGTATRDELSARDERLRATAQACRARAQVALLATRGEDS